MDIEAQLYKLEARYRAVLSTAVAAKAHYFGLAGVRTATSVAIEVAKIRWQALESRKRAIAARMGELEAIEEVTA
jgi:hypothetical protein